MPESDRPRLQLFWISGNFIVFVTFLIGYGFLSLLGAVVGLVLFGATYKPEADPDAFSYLCILLLFNLVICLPVFAIVGIILQYVTWKVTRPPAPAPVLLARADSELKALIAGLDEPDSRARISAIQALRTRNLPVVDEALTRALMSDPSPEVRAEAYRALKFMGRAKTGLLFDALKGASDKDEKLRLIELLRTAGDPAQVRTLLDLYPTESDRDLKLSILESLGRFDGEGIRSLAVGALRNDTDREVRLKALRVLGWYSDAQVIDLIRYLLNDPDDAVRAEATKMFHIYGPQPAKPEKVIITEIVKRPCPYCGMLTEVTNSKCPGCGAAIDH